MRSNGRLRALRRGVAVCAALSGLIVGNSSCKRGPVEEDRPAKAVPKAPQAASAEVVGDFGRFVSRPIGNDFEGMPWVTDLTLVDLDQDGLVDVALCEGRLNEVSWIRQTRPREYEEIPLTGSIAGPAHVEAVDIDLDGDLDLLVAGMGIVTPSNEHLGTVNILENDGSQNFTLRVLLEKVPRVTDVQAGDLDGDGDLDLSVAQFGYHEGEIRWLENRGDWRFESQQLLGLSGAIHAPIVDIDGDEDADIVALVSQDWEEVYAFRNEGAGAFAASVLYGSTNKDYGSSGLTIADLDRDGDADIVYTNGDAFDYPTPGQRRWHGVQWLVNDGTGAFAYRHLGYLSGSYSPKVIDLDGDGNLDIVVVSGFNEWSDPSALSLVWFKGDGEGEFEQRALARAPTHLMVLDAADMDGDGNVELVTGAFHFYPPYDKLSRVTLWEMP